MIAANATMSAPHVSPGGRWLVVIASTTLFLLVVIIGRCKGHSTMIVANAAMPAPPHNSSMLDPGSILGDKMVFYSRVHISVVTSLIKNILNSIGIMNILN